MVKYAIPFSKPTLGREEERAAIRILRSGWLAAGTETEAFEREFANYVGVKYAIFTNSCTSALKLAYKWYRLRAPFGHLFIPRNTYCATYAAAEEMGQSWSFDNSPEKKLQDPRTMTHKMEILY